MKTLFDISSSRRVLAPLGKPSVTGQGYALAILLIAICGIPSLSIAEELNAEQVAALEAVISAPPTPVPQLPDGGTFYSAQRPDCPPLPTNLYGLPAWDLGEGVFLVDDIAIDFEPSAQAIEVPGLPLGGTSMNSQPHTSNDLWLAINAMTNGSTSWTADLTIHTLAGDTNSSYDVLYAPTLDSPTDWQFLMRCSTNIIAQTNVFARYLCEEQGFFGLKAPANCNLVVNSNATPQAMAELLVPPWVTVSSATNIGSGVAGGEFSNGNCAGFPVDSGVILSSGNITNALGPNDDHGGNEQSSDVGGAPDADLDDLVMGELGTDDAAVLEFNVVSTNSFTLQFRYVYASEEYPEYSGKDYNDPMGIFVSTNLVGGQWELGITNNIALLPGSTNVMVNTVNGGCTADDFGYYVPPTNALYYVDNHDRVYDSVPPYSVGKPVFNTQYDGMTVLLVADVNIAASVTNHIKIAIADYHDQVYDSAVLLEAWASAPCP